MSPSNILGQLFARSPIGPLQEHMDKVADCTVHLLDFYDAVAQNEWDKAREERNIVASLEKEADDIKNKLRAHLSSELLLPVPRYDILEMVTLQDRIANMAKDIAGLILGRELIFPEVITVSYRTFLKHCIDAVEQAHAAVGQLDNLLETGFKGKEVRQVEHIINKIHHIEHQTDEMQVEIRQALFSVEKNYSPIDMMFLYKIIEWTGDIADRAEKVGSQLNVFMAR